MDDKIVDIEAISVAELNTKLHEWNVKGWFCNQVISYDIKRKKIKMTLLMTKKHKPTKLFEKKEKRHGNDPR